MRRKLWPKAPAKEGALGQMSTNFQVYFIHINFFKKPKKRIYNRAKKLYCDAAIFVFFNSLLRICPKKIEIEKWPKAADSPLVLRYNYPDRELAKIALHGRYTRDISQGFLTICQT